MAFGLAVGNRAISGHVQRVGIGLFQDGDRLAHGFRFVDTRSKAHQRSARRLVRQAVALFSADLDQQRIDLLA